MKKSRLSKEERATLDLIRKTPPPTYDEEREMIEAAERLCSILPKIREDFGASSGMAAFLEKWVGTVDRGKFDPRAMRQAAAAMEGVEQMIALLREFYKETTAETDAAFPDVKDKPEEDPSVDGSGH